MIELYYAPTPNGQKVSILLEEAEIPYRVVPINLMKGEQFDENFLAICPNGKIPAMVDLVGPGGEPYHLFESGAILIYLAEKVGAFLPDDHRKRYDVIQWLMFQMAGVGPMLGQTHHFLHYASEKVAYGINRYTRETARIYKVLDTHLGKTEFLADDYSIADMATYPWIACYKQQNQALNDYPNLKRWYDTIKQRPAVRRGFALMRDYIPEKMDEEARKILYGQAGTVEERGE